MARETKKREEDYSAFMSNVLDDEDDEAGQGADVKSLLKKRDHSGLKKSSPTIAPVDKEPEPVDAAPAREKPRFSLGAAPDEGASRIRVKLATSVMEEIISFRDQHASVTLKSVTPAMWKLYKDALNVAFDDDGELAEFDIMTQQRANVRLATGKETSTLIFPVSHKDKEEMGIVIKSVGGLRYRQMVELMWDLYKTDLGIDMSQGNKSD